VMSVALVNILYPSRPIGGPVKLAFAAMDRTTQLSSDGGPRRGSQPRKPCNHYLCHPMTRLHGVIGAKATGGGALRPSGLKSAPKDARRRRLHTSPLGRRSCDAFW